MASGLCPLWWPWPLSIGTIQSFFISFPPFHVVEGTKWTPYGCSYACAYNGTQLLYL